MEEPEDYHVGVYTHLFLSYYILLITSFGFGRNINSRV